MRPSAAGDSDGKVHLLDPRAPAGGAVNTLQLHKPGSKVNAVAVNPVGGARVVVTAGGVCWGVVSCVSCGCTSASEVDGSHNPLWLSLFALPPL